METKLIVKIKSFLTIVLIMFIIGCEDEISVDKRYKDGKLVELIHFRGKLRHGERIIYFPNGAVKLRELYFKGQLSGNKYLYFENGNTEAIWTFSNGKEEGEYRGFYRNGGLRTESTYTGGIQNGVYKEYFENGNLKILANYQADKLNGLVQYFSINGKLTAEALFLNGEALSVKEYDEKGSITKQSAAIRVKSLSSQDVLLGDKIRAEVLFFGDLKEYDVSFEVTQELIQNNNLILKDGKALIEYKPLKSGKKVFYVFAAKIDSPQIAKIDTFHFNVR